MRADGAIRRRRADGGQHQRQEPVAPGRGEPAELDGEHGGSAGVRASYTASLPEQHAHEQTASRRELRRRAARYPRAPPHSASRGPPPSARASRAASGDQRERGTWCLNDTPKSHARRARGSGVLHPQRIRRGRGARGAAGHPLHAPRAAGGGAWITGEMQEPEHDHDTPRRTRTLCTSRRST